VSRILHLEDDLAVLESFKIAVEGQHIVVPCRSLSEANETVVSPSIFVCGPLGKNSDGLIFALEKAREGKKVLVLADRRKFSRLPFLSVSALSDKAEVLRTIARVMAGG